MSNVDKKKILNKKSKVVHHCTPLRMQTETMIDVLERFFGACSSIK